MTPDSPTEIMNKATTKVARLTLLMVTWTTLVFRMPNTRFTARVVAAKSLLAPIMRLMTARIPMVSEPPKRLLMASSMRSRDAGNR